MNALPFPTTAAGRLQQMAEAAAIPGLCVVTSGPVRDGVFFHGEDSAETARPVDEDSWFQLASAVKHVTACVVLDLAARGDVSIDRSIGEYLPDTPADLRDRSVRSLLHHTSGLPEYLAYVADERPPATRDEFMALAASLSDPRPEGQFWSYSNTNYILLGLLIAEITGEPAGVAVDALLRSRVGEAGARAASPEWARQANAQQLGPFAEDAESRSREIFGDGDVAFNAGGALGWLKTLIGGAQVAEPVSENQFAPAQVETGTVPYGCGWFLDSVGGDTVAYHAGHYDGWAAMAYLNRSSRCGVIAMSNLAPGNTRAIRAIALQALEDLVPGSTPLAQHPIDDDQPELTKLLRHQLFRAGYDADPISFAPELRLSLDLQGAPRGIINLWTGAEPLGFDPVEQLATSEGSMRRYRIRYPDRIEHLHVRTNRAGQISWAWPL